MKSLFTLVLLLAVAVATDEPPPPFLFHRDVGELRPSRNGWTQMSFGKPSVEWRFERDRWISRNETWYRGRKSWDGPGDGYAYSPYEPGRWSVKLPDGRSYTVFYGPKRIEADGRSFSRAPNGSWK